MVRKRTIAKYTLLPEVLPRFLAFFRQGFSYLASVVAVLYFNLGLLPKDHPYLNPQNYGLFGLRHVITEAGRNLVFSRNNLDQIIAFFTILIGFVILAVQIILVVMSFLFYPAMASTFYNMFVARPILPDQDISYIILDRVFGVMNFSGTAGFFESCYSNTGIDCTNINGDIIASPTTFPLPFHDALHQMLQFYTLGIFFLSGVIILYSILAIVGETIVSGSPFGKRINKSWFIPRLIMFFILIAPLNMTTNTAVNNAGISTAQFITLGVAKVGSNMATNAWTRFNTTLATSVITGDNREMIALSQVPEVAQLTQFMYIVRTCMYAENVINNKIILPYIVRENSTDSRVVKLHTGGFSTYDTMSFPGDMLPYFTTTLEQAFQFSRYGPVTVRFGHYNPPGSAPPLNPDGVNDKDLGYVEPTCGELTIPFISMEPAVVGGGYLTFASGVQENYYESIEEYITNDEFADVTSKCIVESVLPYDNDTDCVNQSYSVSYFPGIYFYNTQWPTIEAARRSVEWYDRMNRFFITGYYFTSLGFYVYNPFNSLADIRAAYATLFGAGLPPLIAERGWAGAALWYNNIAEINGSISAAMNSLPRPYKYPLVMEKLAAQHAQVDKSANYTDRFNPLLGNGKSANFSNSNEQHVAAALYTAYRFWERAQPQTTNMVKTTGNAVIDVINMIFGTSGLLNIMDNQGTHPLAMLSALGKSMVDRALQNLLYGVVGQGVGSLLSQYFVGDLGKIAGGFFLKVGLLAFSIGFILYYVLPFMPFIYFFFAFAGWIKSIFEAMVAMPLWALAHIKLDGNGLPGPWATNGYFLLFEIFVRPTLIIFGFLASINIFASLVDVLNGTFRLVAANVGGRDFDAFLNGSATIDHSTMLSSLDQFMFMIVYTIIVYMLALSSFKLIDSIPNNILRWMGVMVSTFHDIAGDPASQLSGQMFRGTQMASTQLRSMIDRSASVLQTNIQLQNTLKPGGK